VDRRKQNEERRRQRELAEIEETIHGLESMLSKLEHDLAKASMAQNLPEIQRLSVAHEETQRRLDKSLVMWEQLAEPVE
jgi:ATP-binding cassette subfamily F protein 3